VTTIPRGRVTRIGKTWAFVIDIPSADGRRRQRKRGGFATQREATAELDQLRSSLYGGTFSQRHSLTLEEYLLDTWMPAKISQGLRPGTLHSYRSHLARPIKLLGHVGLQDVTPLELDELYRLMSTDGLSPRTIRYTHGLLLQALAYAQRKGFASRNVAALADPPSAKLSAADHRPQAWDASQCRAFLEATTRDRLAALWHLFLATGARRGELLALGRRRPRDRRSPDITFPHHGRLRGVRATAENGRWPTHHRNRQPSASGARPSPPPAARGTPYRRSLLE
jgi:integrase